MILLDDGTGGARVVRPGLRDRLLARLRGHRLDVDLACGVSPDRDVQHALRARTLVSERTRTELARALDRLAREHPVAPLTALPRARATELRALRAMVGADAPLSVRTIALARLLIGDAANGLYAAGPVRPDLLALLARADEAVVRQPSG